MVYQNGRIYQAGRGFVPGGFRVENGVFAEVFEGTRASAGEDLAGAMVIPGLVDVHTHGNSGADFSDGEEEGLRRMARYLAARGVTSFAPTSMSLPCERLSRAFQTAVLVRDNPMPDEAEILGVHMEGPFFSERRKGAQNADYLRNPDFEDFLRLYEGCGGLIKIADAAPELPGAATFAERASVLCLVSAAHTDADYGTACRFFDAGARHLTHLFNAMPPLHHREPGVIGAAAERDNVTAELIADGVHVHESAVRLAFRLFPHRICLISDALRCTGMPDGTYDLAGEEVRLSGGVARLSDGTIAGASSDLYEDMLKAVSFGIAPEDAVEAATHLPARVLCAEETVGAIASGRRADFVICDGGLHRRRVFLRGREIKAA